MLPWRTAGARYPWLVVGCSCGVASVTLHGFGKNHTIRAPLVNLTVCIRDGERDDLSEIPIVCAVTDLCAAVHGLFFS